MTAQSHQLGLIEDAHPGPRAVNVGLKERWGSLFSGGVLVAAGLRKRSLGGAVMAAAGGELIRRGVTGHCHIYSALHISSAEDAPLHAVSSVLVTRPAGELYAYWRDFNHHPRFMVHLESVTTTLEGRTQWTLSGPLHSHIEWESEVVDEQPNKRIAWRTTEGSELPHSGVVTFEPAPAGRGTIVRVEIAYEPRAAAAAVLGKVLGFSPQALLDQDLRRFRQLMETGELSTLEGQTSGPRSKGLGALFRAVERNAMPAPELRTPHVATLAATEYVDL
jgi:uncharacterized membrane protein